MNNSENTQQSGIPKRSTKRAKSNRIFVVADGSNSSTNEKVPNFSVSLHSEKIIHEEKSIWRIESFKSIISNNNSEFSGHMLIVYTFGIAIIGFMATLSFSLIPAHDLIQSPEFWYEILFHGGCTTTLGWWFRSIEVDKFLNIQYFQQWRKMISIILIGVIIQLIFLVTAYYIWTSIYDFQFPIPFLGLLSTYSMNIVYFIVCWFSFPKKWRKNNNFRKRYVYFVVYQVLSIIAPVIYMIIVGRLRKSVDKYQPLNALMLPIVRELTLWICGKLVIKMADGDVQGATIVLKYRILGAYGVTICNVIGSTATDQTSWVLIGIDLLFNIYVSHRIVWLKKRCQNISEKHIETLQDLAINELVEFQVPLAYLLVLAIAYIGPNGKLFGNILNSYWQYSAIENIDTYLMSTAILFCVDIASAAASAITLWVFCKINLLKAFLNIQQEFWKVFAVFLARFLVLVSLNENDKTYQLDFLCNLQNQ